MIQDDNRKRMFTEAAAALAGRDPGEMDELEAIYILMEYESEARGDLYRRLVRKAAEEYFDDPENVKEWSDAADIYDKDIPDLVAFSLRRELAGRVREEAERLRAKLEEDPAELDGITGAIETEKQTDQEREKMLRETVEALKTLLDQQLNDPTAAALEAVRCILDNNEAVMEAVKSVGESVKNVLEKLDTWSRVGDLVEKFAEKTPLFSLYRWATSEELAPYMAEELKKPQYNGKTFQELWQETETDDDGLFPNESLIMQAVIAADAARLEAEPEAAGTPADWRPAEIIRYKNRKAPNVSLNVGKGALRLFDAREWARVRALAKRDRDEVPGQLSLFTIQVGYEKAGADEITLYCGMTSDSFLSTLTPEDFFALSFVDDAFVNGNTKCTLHWFFREYYGGKPSEKQLTDLYNKLEALAGTTLKINDKQVQEAWSDDKRAKYREIVQAAAPIKLGAEKYIASGQVSDATMHIYDRPLVLQADRVAKHITTVPKSLLQVKKDNGRFVSRTPRFYRVLFHLIRRITFIKHGGANCMELDGFYMDVGEETARGRALAYSVMMDIIHHFEREGWITSHKAITSKTTGRPALEFTWTNDAGRITSKGTRKRGRRPRKKTT